MFHRRSRFVICIAVVGLLIGCRPVTLPTQAPEVPVNVDAAAPKATNAAGATPASGGDAMSGDTQQLDSVTVAAMADLSARLGVSPDQITVVSVEPVVWPDAGLGCPQPGMMYAQVLQDGMRIVLRVDGKEYVYHSGETTPPFLCENPTSGG